MLRPALEAQIVLDDLLNKALVSYCFMLTRTRVETFPLIRLNLPRAYSS